MAKYNENTLSGEQWTRAFQIIITNEHEQIPTIKFDEEDIILSADNKTIIHRTGSNIQYAFNPLEAEIEFDLINPTTDLNLGVKAKYQDLYILLYSVYYHLAKLRDRGPKPYFSWVWNELIQQWEAPTVKPYPSWTWDENIVAWVAPIEQPYPNYIWNETNQTWIAP